MSIALEKLFKHAEEEGLHLVARFKPTANVSFESSHSELTIDRWMQENQVFFPICSSYDGKNAVELLLGEVFLKATLYIPGSDKKVSIEAAYGDIDYVASAGFWPRSGLYGNIRIDDLTDIDSIDFLCRNLKSPGQGTILPILIDWKKDQPK